MDLPDELWLRAFHYLTLGELLTVGATSKRFHVLASENDLWLDIVYSPKFPPSVKLCPHIPVKYGVLQCLYVKNYETLMFFSRHGDTKRVSYLISQMIVGEIPATVACTLAAKHGHLDIVKLMYRENCRIVKPLVGALKHHQWRVAKSLNKALKEEPRHEDKRQRILYEIGGDPVALEKFLSFK